eukprot:gene13016-13145_t
MTLQQQQQLLQLMQATLSHADAVAAKTAKKVTPVVAAVGKPPVLHQALPGATAMTAGAAAAAVPATKKRKLEQLPMVPDEAISFNDVLLRRQQAPAAGGGLLGALAGFAGSGAAAGAGAGGSSAAGLDGPSLSVDEILRRPEFQRGKAGPAAASSSAVGRRLEDDEARVLPEGQLRRLLELQGLQKGGHVRFRPPVLLLLLAQQLPTSCWCNTAVYVRARHNSIGGVR